MGMMMRMMRINEMMLTKINVNVMMMVVQVMMMKITPFMSPVLY